MGELAWRVSELRIPHEVRKHTKPVENEFDDDTHATGERSAVYLGKHDFEINDKQLCNICTLNKIEMKTNIQGKDTN